MSAQVSKDGSNRQLAEQVYSMIMGKIDEDLLLENIPNLDEKYKEESPEDRQKRMMRYKESYKKFDQEMAAFMVNVHDRSRKSKTAALREKETMAKKDEDAALDSLELSFQ